MAMYWQAMLHVRCLCGRTGSRDAADADAGAQALRPPRGTADGSVLLTCVLPACTACLPACRQVHGDATILFPLLVSQTFAKHWKPVTPPKPKQQATEPGVFKASFD